MIHNLDENVTEYFDFTVKGHTYRFRHLNTSEISALSKLSDGDGKEDDLREYLYQFIAKVDEASPEFPDIAKEMTTPHWVAFRKMITEEFSG